MRNRLLYLLLITACFSFQNKPIVTRWVITNGCSLKVDGSTNVNSFSCAISNYGRPDTIYVARNGFQQVLMRGNISLDVQSFDCNNLIMTADLRKTLKAKEFPQLMIRFISMNKYPDPGVRQDITKGIVLIELAGVTKKFEVDYRVVSSGNTSITMVGSRVVNFSDFLISPPRKLGGMIKTNNELSVVFNLKMKVLET